MKLSKDEFVITADVHHKHLNVVKFDQAPYWSEKARFLDRQIKQTDDEEERKVLRRQEVEELKLNMREREEAIVSNWNDAVDPDQYVINVGDFTFSNDVAEIGRFMDRLNGKMIYINGNHEGITHKIKDRFHMIRDYLELRVGNLKICISHYPFHEWNQCHRGAWMLHGHTHTKDTYDDSFKICNVGIMNWDYAPASYHQIEKYMSTKKDYKYHH